jgi:hypothetical protein
MKYPVRIQAAEGIVLFSFDAIDAVVPTGEKTSIIYTGERATNVNAPVSVIEAALEETRQQVLDDESNPPALEFVAETIEQLRSQVTGKAGNASDQDDQAVTAPRENPTRAVGDRSTITIPASV